MNRFGPSEEVMPKELVVKWAEKVGYQQAIARLITRGIGHQTAYLLTRGKYKCAPRAMLLMVLKDELLKDGISPDQAS